MFAPTKNAKDFIFAVLHSTSCLRQTRANTIFQNLTRIFKPADQNFQNPFVSFSNPREPPIPQSISPRCTFINTSSLKPICQICYFSKPDSPISPSSSSNQESWSCKAYAFLNPYKVSSCEIRRTRKSSFGDNINLEDDELQLDCSAVGNAFLPLLQKCSNAKRKSGDEPVDVSVPRGLKSANKMVVDSDEIEPKQDLKTLKILSYNVWFAEDVELRIRMRAIGDIIQLHRPDVICLQEVTPGIYSIIQKSNWWKSYKCSLSSDKVFTRPYFCMQLSKLPVKSFSCKQFSYSAMGRELCIAEVSVPGDTPLVVATTHLESPCPGPPKWDQMYSKERVKQAQEAVAFLNDNPNVIFCGDMNWDDKLDGEFPLPDGWIDAWTELNPKEIGWTYDTKSNPMLSANRKLQKRLDRFLTRLRDFKVECIKMVGTKAIPEVTYMKQKKGGKEMELPVLPSDHFGLLLTMSAL